MAFQPVAVRNPARASTSTVPMLVDVFPPVTAGAAATHVELSTSFAPIRTRPGARSLNKAMSGAFVAVKNPSLMCVFSKLNPANPWASAPIFIARLTVTVPAVVGPLNAGPPSNRLASPNPASPLLTDVPASPEDAPDPSGDPPDESAEASTAADEDPTAPEPEDDAPGEPEDDVAAPDDETPVVPDDEVPAVPDDEALAVPDDEALAVPDEPPDDPVEAPDRPPDGDPVPSPGLPPEFEPQASIVPLRTAHAAKRRPASELRPFLK